jgi:hypothetical protein
MRRVWTRPRRHCVGASPQRVVGDAGSAGSESLRRDGTGSAMAPGNLPTVRCGPCGRRCLRERPARVGGDGVRGVAAGGPRRRLLLSRSPSSLRSIRPRLPADSQVPDAGDLLPLRAQCSISEGESPAFPVTVHFPSPSFPSHRHSRAGGNPGLPSPQAANADALDSRLRGNDESLLTSRATSNASALRSLSPSGRGVRCMGNESARRTSTQ